jgi:chemotaxis protein methyltransferase CheR
MYVTFHADGSGTIEPSIRAEVTFRRLNLLNPWPFRQPFDVIFCRNVLIYFDTDLRHRVIGRLIDALVHGGVLYVSHTENVPRGRFPIRPLATSAWMKEGA